MGTMTPAIGVMFLIPYAVALLLFAIEVARPGWYSRRIPSIGSSASWIVAIVVSYAATLAMIWTQAQRSPIPMPMPVMMLATRAPDVTAIAMLLLGAVQTYGLLVIFRRGVTDAWLAAGTGSLLLLSLVAPALSSGDPYSNVGYALLGPSAYTPPDQPFSSNGFAAINVWWGTPMVPAPYGPLWLLIDRLVTAPFPTLLGKILALRGLGAAALLLFAWTLPKLGFSRRFEAVTLLNPALALHFVCDGHNDIVAIAAIAVAAVAVRKHLAAIAALLIAAAAVIKLPYAVLGLPVLARVRSLPIRCALAAAVVAASLGCSWLFGGTAYFAALRYHAQSMTFGAWHAIAVLVALAILSYALVRIKRYRLATWLLAPIGAISPAFIYPWYLTWAVPYALASRRVLGYLLVWLPFVATLVNQQYERVWTLVLVFPAIAALALYKPRARASAANRSTSGS